LSYALGIKKTKTSVLYPQSGQVERQHQIILNYLAKFVSENQRDRWIKIVGFPCICLRINLLSMTGVTSAELYLARDLKLSIDLFQGNLSDKREPNTTKDCISHIEGN